MESGPKAEVKKGGLMKEVFKYINASQEGLVIKYTDSFAIVEVINVLGDSSTIFINKKIAEKLIKNLNKWIKDNKVASDKTEGV